MAVSQITLTTLTGEPHPDHHLWRNGRLYWAAFTVHLPGWKKQRVRISLGTSDRFEARQRRDSLLQAYATYPGYELSLRFEEPRTRRLAS